MTRSNWDHLLSFSRLIPKKSFWGVLPEALSSYLVALPKRIQIPEKHYSKSELLNFPYPSFEIGIFGSNPSLHGVLLDEALYRIGYGEDTEWCIRARGLGWSIRSFDWQRSYQTSATFGLAKNSTKAYAKKLIKAMHPKFTEDLRRCERNLQLGI
jgi:hypothetical protein